jgi:hypothetical protein
VSEPLLGAVALHLEILGIGHCPYTPNNWSMVVRTCKIVQETASCSSCGLNNERIQFSPDQTPDDHDHLAGSLTTQVIHPNLLVESKPNPVLVAISGGREWTGARPDTSPGGGFSHHVLREQWPCLSFYPHQLAAAHPSHDTWSGPVGSLPLPGAGFVTGAGTCCHAQLLSDEQSPRCLSHGHCIARDIPSPHPQ